MLRAPAGAAPTAAGCASARGKCAAGEHGVVFQSLPAPAREVSAYMFCSHAHDYLPLFRSGDDDLQMRKSSSTYSPPPPPCPAENHFLTPR